MKYGKVIAATGKIVSFEKTYYLWDMRHGRDLALRGGAWWYAM